MPRPRKSAALSAAERNRRKRKARGLYTVEISAEARVALVRIQERDGDPSIRAAASRVIIEADKERG